MSKQFKPNEKHLKSDEWEDFLEYLQYSDTPTFKDFIKMKIHYAFSDYFDKSHANLVYGISEWDDKLYEIPLDEGEEGLIWLLLKSVSNEKHNIVNYDTNLDDIKLKDIDDLLYKIDYVYKDHPNAEKFKMIPNRGG
tara:strand:+ start:131 stop:541 length:411 start_codon:yes stop_codon:yes gene_type:complete